MEKKLWAVIEKWRIQHILTFQFTGGTFNIIVIVRKIEMATRVQILDKVVCISFYTNAFGKGMNPFYLTPVMGK